MPLHAVTSCHQPGLLLAAPNVIDDVKVFSDNGWEVVPCVESDDWMGRDPNYVGKSGKWIAMNVLPLSPDKVHCCTSCYTSIVAHRAAFAVTTSGAIALA